MNITYIDTYRWHSSIILICVDGQLTYHIVCSGNPENSLYIHKGVKLRGSDEYEIDTNYLIVDESIKKQILESLEKIKNDKEYFLPLCNKLKSFWKSKNVDDYSDGQILFSKKHLLQAFESGRNWAHQNFAEFFKQLKF